MAITQPWDRPEQPAPIPEGNGAISVLRSLDSNDFDLLIRDNLTAWESQQGGRVRWERLWAALAGEASLRDRALETMQTLRSQTDGALQAGELNQAGKKRATRFLRHLDHGVARLTRQDDRPLAWAGRAADGFNPPARVVIERLVLAIAHHREVFPSEDDPSQDDEDLWAVLGDVGLDPNRLRRARRRD